MIEDLEMSVYAWCAWRLTHHQSPARTLRASARVASVLKQVSSKARSADHDRAAKLAERWVRLVSRGRGDCYDRAVAARWWLARRGVSVSVVIGVRKGEAGRLEGHAWIEDEDGESYLVDSGAGYKEVERG